MPLRKWLAALLAALAALVVLAAPGGRAAPGRHAASPALSIARFRGNRVAAVSFTFDDGSENQASIASRVLDEFGLKGSFYVVPGLTRDRKSDPLPKGAFRDSIGGASWEEWRDVARRGHEIGNHSLTHPFLTRITDEKLLEREIEESRRLITEKIGTPPLSFVYPHDRFNPHVRALVLAHHAAGREKDIIWGYPSFTARAGIGEMDRALAERAWIVPVFHGVEQGYDPVSRETLRAIFAAAHKRRDRLWVDTFGNVARYREERQKAVLVVLARSADSLRFSLTSPLDPQRFNEPLTVVLRGRPGPAVVSRQGDAASLPTKQVPGGLMVDVVPGPQPLTVTWPARK